jgi:ABC-type branched-subunit amino acid transport system substrate-binding protein
MMLLGFHGIFSTAERTKVNLCVRRAGFLISLLAVSLSCFKAFAASSLDPGITDNQILLGTCGALSGPAAGLGNQELIGITAYINSINDAGGIEGRKIKIKSYDDGYEETKAVAAFNKFKQDKCFAGIGFVGSMTTKQYLPLLEENQIPVVGFMTGAEFIQQPFHKYAFAVRAAYVEEMASQIDRIWRDLGPKKIAVIHQTQTGGSPIERATEAALKKHDAKPVAVAAFPHNTVDVDAAIKTAQISRPDIVVLTGPYTPLAEIVKRCHAAGWSPLFMTSSMVGTEEFVQAAGKDADGTLISQILPPFNRIDLPTVVLYNQLLKKYFPREKPNFVSFEGFVDAMVMCEGLKLAGKELSRAKLVSALESIKDRDMGLGPNLKLNYGPHRHQGFDGVYTTQVRDGIPQAYFSAKQIKH